MLQKTKKVLQIVDRTNVFNESNIGLLPEREMWRCVLISGLKGALKGDQKELRWLNSDCDARPGAFIWICKALQLECWKEIRIWIFEGGEFESMYRRIKRLHRVTTMRQGS